MDIFLIAAIVFVSLIVLGYPLINGRKYRNAPVLSGNVQLESLENARVQTLDAIRDLQFDHMTGKLSDSDYQSLRSQYESKAASVLQQLDMLRGQPSQKAHGKQACPRCDANNDALDKFCVKCGLALTA
jgi:hypothetical protein